MILWGVRVILVGGIIWMSIYFESDSWETQKIEFKAYCEGYARSYMIEGCEVYY